jgi:UPF0716 family protein affecting phage T7 exclusion
MRVAVIAFLVLLLMVVVCGVMFLRWYGKQLGRARASKFNRGAQNPTDTHR